MLPDAVHEVVELEVAVAYRAGYDQGVRDASAAVDAAIDEATAGMHPSAKDVVDQLVRNWEREAA